MMRWLLKGFEEGIERRRREHVYLVDNEYRVATLLRDDAHLLDKVANIVDRVVRGSIELVDIQRASLIERATRLALVARLATLRVETVYRLGEDTRTGGLADTSRPTEEVGVSKLSALNGILQCRGYMTLSHNRRECCGAILTC